ncbi:DUF2264 domain-containing protein [Streptomyces litchfieldiae]|uniref:DUF2264 domain-containing protein n=1 Tax=Streptomyces litchfieldiae TaxID=3075543 RepID=A0ABU2MNG6_9ACTN|nr:DUF2264 domain-containing protein [Streptomyces sp. DSM 44938]MDT0343157.1 DUF2264 domain-containing protein [Streptomyces sp. DSM 44938]
MAATDAWYRGDGWYTDGGERNFDHYNGWAMHFYPLWYCRVSGADAEPGLADRYRERLRLFLADAAHLVAGNGSPLHQGRSLVHRFAAAAPLWTGALFDAMPLPPGLTSALVARPGTGTVTPHRAEGANAFGRHSATPVYEGTGPAHAVALFLGVIPDGTLPPAPDWEFTAEGVTVSWPDGTTDTVRLAGHSA